MTLKAQRPSRTKEKLLQAVGDDNHSRKKRLNADIDENLYKQIRMRALDEGRSVSDITRELWVEYLSK